MIKLVLLLFSISACNTVVSQKRQSLAYEGKLHTKGKPVNNESVNMGISILKGAAERVAVYSERQSVRTDSLGNFRIEIGNGFESRGKFDSIIWSDGVFYLRTKVDSLKGIQHPLTEEILLRIPPELNNDYEQGTVESSEFPDHGVWHFRNTRHKRPKLVTIDLTTSYVNLAYPADTYPVYRHYEWCDPDLDGKGNAFMISYSDNTNNSFVPNTTKLGEVRLYSIPFQELNLSSNTNEISVSITKPVAVRNLSETYAIKGPWKFIYYIEW